MAGQLYSSLHSLRRWMSTSKRRPSWQPTLASTYGYPTLCVFGGHICIEQNHALEAPDSTRHTRCNVTCFRFCCKGGRTTVNFWHVVAAREFLSRKLLVDNGAVDDLYFILLTDHNPLTSAPHTESSLYFPREVRHLDYIFQFMTNLHIGSEPNCVADTSSHP